jgi:hypothetical protein
MFNARIFPNFQGSIKTTESTLVGAPLSPHESLDGALANGTVETKYRISRSLTKVSMFPLTLDVTDNTGKLKLAAPTLPALLLLLLLFPSNVNPYSP